MEEWKRVENEIYHKAVSGKQIKIYVCFERCSWSDNFVITAEYKFQKIKVFGARINVREDGVMRKLCRYYMEIFKKDMVWA